MSKDQEQEQTTDMGTEEAKPKRGRRRAPKAADAAPSAEMDVQPRGNRAFPSPAELETIEKIVTMAQASGLMASTLTREEAIIVGIKGWELGLPPLQALDGLYVTSEADGRKSIAMQAEVMRAMINGSGVGLIEAVKVEDDECIMRGTRFGRGQRADTVNEYRYSMQDAERAGLHNQEKYRKHPKGSLMARATSLAGRAMFSDILRGVSYTPEELESSRSSGAAVKREPVPTITPPQSQASPAAVPANAKTTPEETPPAEKVESHPAKTGVPMTGTANQPQTVRQPDGSILEVKTAGVTAAQIEEIAGLTYQAKADGNRDYLDAVMGKLKALGASRVSELTEAGGAALLDAIRPEPKAAPEAKADPQQEAKPTRSQLERYESAIVKFLNKIGVEGYEERVQKVLCDTHKVNALDQIPEPAFVQSLAELHSLAQEPTIFKQLIDQQLQGVAI